MLRITLVRESKPPTLKLEGRLSGPWVHELDHTWREILKHQLQGSVSVDLSDITFISSEGKTLLKSMFEQGVDIHTHSLMTQFILSQITNESNE